MKKVLTLILIISLSSCYTAKKAARQVIKAQTNYPAIVAENCALWYPPKEYTSSETRYIRGKDSIVRDTTFIDCSLPANIDRIVQVPVIREVWRVDTLEKEVIKQVENTAKVAALNLQNTELQAAHNQLQGANKALRRQVYIYQIISVILTLFIIIKFIK